jgi:hypothetical protein
MLRTLTGVLAVALLAAVGWGSPVQAVPISGLSDTGSGVAIGVADPNWSLDVGTAIAIVRHSNWVAPPAGSQWIGLTNGSVTDPDGNYTFTTTFDLTGFDPNTASISGNVAVDNSATFKLNGVDTGVSALGFAILAPFLINADFVSGLNTLEIIVTNFVQSSGNPMGLLISGLTGDVAPVPLPAALPLFGAGLAALGFAGWRRRRQAGPA